MKFPAVDLVLNAVVREMHLIIEVRQLVLARPLANLVPVAAWSAVAVRPVAVVVLQELLVFALQVLFEDDTSDLEVRVLVSKTSLLLAKCRVQIRVMVHLPRAADSCVEELRPLTLSLQGVRIEQVSSLGRERQSTLAVAQIDRLDEPLIVKVVQGVARKIEIVFWHDAKRTDGSQRAAVLAVELVDAIAINNQLSLVATGQVEIARQAVTGVALIPIACVVHARQFVTEIPHVVLARIVPSASDIAPPWRRLDSISHDPRSPRTETGIRGEDVWLGRLFNLEQCQRVSPHCTPRRNHTCHKRQSKHQCCRNQICRGVGWCHAVQ